MSGSEAVVSSPFVTELCLKLTTQGMGMDLSGNFFYWRHLCSAYISSVMKFQGHMSWLCVSISVVYVYAFKYCFSKDVFESALNGHVSSLFNLFCVWTGIFGKF